MSDMTSSEVVEALDRKYGQNSTSSQKQEQWVVIPEARSGASFDGNRRQCDYLAINTWKSQGLQLIGHEIKVSMSDWRRELDDPTKAEMFARHCRRWWVVMPSELAREVKPEIPPTWGLMSVSEKGRITETAKAPAREPKSVPVWWWVGWLAQLDRRDKRSVRHEIDRKVSEKWQSDLERTEKEVEARVQRRLSQVENLSEMADRLREVTGIDLRRTWDYQIDRLGKIWPLATSGQDLEAVIDRMRSAADLLEHLSAPVVIDESHEHQNWCAKHDRRMLGFRANGKPACEAVYDSTADDPCVFELRKAMGS